jgi:Spy/CpxP family protein refolding chaperone
MENNNPTASRTRTEAAVLVFVVFLLGVLVGGLGGHLWGERVWGHSAPARHSGPPSREQIVTDLTRELQLTPDQQKQIGAIIDDTRAQVHAVYAPADAQHEQIRQQGRARIRAILTGDQQPKFDALMQRIDEQRKRNGPPQ